MKNDPKTKALVIYKPKNDDSNKPDSSKNTTKKIESTPKTEVTSTSKTEVTSTTKTEVTSNSLISDEIKKIEDNDFKKTELKKVKKSTLVTSKDHKVNLVPDYIKLDNDFDDIIPNPFISDDIDSNETNYDVDCNGFNYDIDNIKTDYDGIVNDIEYDFPGIDRLIIDERNPLIHPIITPSNITPPNPITCPHPYVIIDDFIYDDPNGSSDDDSDDSSSDSDSSSSSSDDSSSSSDDSSSNSNKPSSDDSEDSSSSDDSEDSSYSFFSGYKKLFDSNSSRLSDYQAKLNSSIREDFANLLEEKASQKEDLFYENRNSTNFQQIEENQNRRTSIPADEFLEIIENSFNLDLDLEEEKTDLRPNKNYGVVTSSKDSIAQIYGLKKVTSGEMISNEDGKLGLVLNLEKHLTGVITFKSNAFKVGDRVFRLHKTLSLPINPFTLSNVYNPLGQQLNAKNFLNSFSSENLFNYVETMQRPVEIKAPGIIVRQPVTESLITGTLGIDGLLPLGRGQRELIIGDRQTGKTSLAIDAILSQSKFPLLILKFLI